MYSFCQTSHPATTVEHSIYCKFYYPDKSNLVVAGGNQLHVYNIIETSNQLLEKQCKLELSQTFELYGAVASMQRISLGSRRDSLVLSFHQAKLSIVEYDPETHDLKTVSMHYFEEEDLRDYLSTPIMRVDPEDRCIAMLIFGREIVVIPLDKDKEEDLDDELYNTSSSDEDVSMEPIDSAAPIIRLPIPGAQVVTLKPAVNPNFRTPFLPSYKLDLSEVTCGEKIDNIVDVQFLHNYNDPTLVILHEPTRTWSGRIAMKQDTFSMVALSMNVHQRLQPIIWTVNNLPYDSLKILPVPKPIGGLLILACNELIYLNQSVPAYGMSFNSFTKDSSAFPLNNQDDSIDKIDYINISLDLSQAVFLNHNKILFILKDGEVYLLTLFNDDMRSIKNFHFERIASTVQPNCLTLCENNLLFIGSHVGDSVLAEIVGDLKSNLVDSYDGDDLNSLASNEGKEPISLREYDKLLSSSSSGRICYGEAPNISDSIRPHDHRDPYVELITTAGHHKDGSICVFQRTIKPCVDDTYDLYGDCGDIWTIKPSKDSEPMNARLILNRDGQTKVFATRGQLSKLEREECALVSSESTVSATNIGGDDLTLQVLSTSVRLISNDKCIDRIDLEEGLICDACVADPHIIAITRNYSIHHIQLRFSPQTNQYNLVHQEIGPRTTGRMISISLYKDISGLFRCTSSKIEKFPDPTYWLFTVDDRGVLEIFSVPEFNSVYSVDNFPSAPSVLADNIKLFVTDLGPTIAKIKEIYMCGLGYENKRALLFVRSDTELMVYEAYNFTEMEIHNHLKIRFKKINSILLEITPTIENGIELSKDQLALTDGRTNGHHRQQQHYHNNNHSRARSRDRSFRDRRWLKEFTNIAGYRGIFLAGVKPHWFIMTDRGALRSHPMNAEGCILAFSPHDNGNFIYITEKRELKIARLATHLNLDSHWPVRKLNMQETVHFVNYHVDRKVYCVVTSSPIQCLKIMKVGSEPDTMKPEELERENGYIPPTIEKFKLRLYDPENWEEVPDCEIEFEEWEQVTCVKNVLLASEGTTSGLKGYIAISTNYCYGEDVPNRGRIWVLDLIEVVPEPDRPLTKNKIKKVYCQEQKGPVTTLSHTCGLLMSAVGQKIYLWQLKEEQLDGVAFIDTQIYIHCASSVKNLILVSDVCKSVSLLRYQQETRTLSMVCRDSKPLEVYACDFAVNNELLNFVVTDSEKNVIIYAHDPKHEDSHGGTRLVRRADFHLGAHVTSFCRLRAKVPNMYMHDQNKILKFRRRHITMFCTVDGAIGFLFPIDEEVYRELQSLQNEMTLALPHAAGLNPKAWRAIKQSRPSITNACKLILDGDVINRFLHLSFKERNELTKKIGTTTDKVLAAIEQIQESTMYF